MAATCAPRASPPVPAVRSGTCAATLTRRPPRELRAARRALSAAAPSALAGTHVPVFHDQSREQLRRMYVEAWRKQRAGEALEPLEAQVARVIAEHPEYHGVLTAGEAA